jgi:hypothetical protein
LSALDVGAMWICGGIAWITPGSPHWLQIAT